jgi:alpha-tubulin suppressor-like RCC1 family protein
MFNRKFWLLCGILLLFNSGGAVFGAILDAGTSHTCAIVNGGVKCWGNNEYGQLGDGTTIDRYIPVDVSGLKSDVISVVAGPLYSCALTSGGGVKCWGGNSFGQLGDGTTTDRHIPVDVNGLTNGVISITLGNFFTSCALTSGGSVKCWGSNMYGQLGEDGTSEFSENVPVDVNDLTSGVISIAVGAYHGCVLTSVGGVKCWGTSNSGQTKITRPADIIGLTSGVTAISAGNDFSCAILNNGTVKCWGNNVVGQLGNGTTSLFSIIESEYYTLVDVTGLNSDIAAIALGNMHSCVLTNGGVKCWGYNSDGQLGDNTTTDKLTPVDTSGLTSDVVAITAGLTYNCALINDGTVKCWGDNSDGQLGDGTTETRRTPVEVQGLNASSSVSQPVVKLLPATEIREYTTTDLGAIDATTFQQQPSEYVSNVFTNLDTNKVTPTEVQKLLPPNWTLDQTTGVLTAPVGEKVTLRTLETAKIPAQVKLPELSNLNTGFGVGGAGTPVLDGMKESLKAANLEGLTLSQDDKGIMHVEGGGIKASVVPDGGDIQVIDHKVSPVGLSVGEGGFYQMTTPEALQVPLIPVPHDPVALSASLNNSEVSLGSSGDVLIELSATANQRRDYNGRFVLMFDPFVEPAPNEWCVITDDTVICDFNNAPENMQPKIHINNTRRTRDGLNLPSGKMIYTDGTSQAIAPTVYSPETFKELAYKFDGVEKIVYNSNGTFYVLYMGLEFILIPNFDVQVQTEGEANITIKDDGKITYLVPVNDDGSNERRSDDRLLFNLFIEPAPESWCVDIGDGEIFCDFAYLL